MPVSLKVSFHLRFWTVLHSFPSRLLAHPTRHQMFPSPGQMPLTAVGIAWNRPAGVGRRALHMSSAHASTGSASWGHRCHQPPSAAPAPLTGDGLAAAGICPPAPRGAETDPGYFHRLLFVASLPALSLALPAAGVPRKPHRQLSGLCACQASLHQSTNMGAEWGCWRQEGKNKISDCQRQSLPRAASLPMVWMSLALET